MSEIIYKGDLKELHFHWCGFFETKQAWRHASRANPDYELMIGVKGTLYLAFDDKEVLLNPGEMLLIEPNCSFRGSRDSEQVSFYWLHFAVEGFSCSK